MAALDDIMSSLDVDQIAQELGVDPTTANGAVEEALGSLITTLSSNVDDESGAVNLTRALGDHLGSPAYGDTIDLSQIDLQDGQKIVNHVYSGDQIQSLSGARGGLVDRLLPMLAPIVMAYLAKQVSGYLKQKTGIDLGGAAQQQQAPSGGLGDLLGSVLGGGAASGGLGDLLGQVLGGGQQAPTSRSAQQSQGGFGLDDLLGQVLGGGQQAQAPTQQSSGSGLDDLLGQILGGGQQAQAPASQPNSGFNVPTSQGGDLRMDPGTPEQSSRSSQSSPSAGGVLGGLLKDILLGGR